MFEKKKDDEYRPASHFSRPQRMSPYEWFLIITIVGFIVGLFVQPYFEMRAFNKFNDQKATYIDALFSNLRINTK